MVREVVGAGALYFAAMFGLGFLLGVVRTLVLEPRLGPAGAVLVEAVPMLAAMWVVAPWAARVFSLPRDAATRLGMGLVGLVLLVAAETVLDALLRGRVMWAERFHTPEGWIGLALLLAFALMPVLRRRA
jgi:hypothetical protein